MSSSAACQSFYIKSDEDTLPYLMESAGLNQFRIKPTVRPAMSVPNSMIDMSMQAAELMNASATEWTKKILIGEERLDYLERAQRTQQMRDPAAFKIPRSKLQESILPRAEAEENLCDSGN